MQALLSKSKKPVDWQLVQSGKLPDRLPKILTQFLQALPVVRFPVLQLVLTRLD
jgi:hypothetical protein